MSHICAIITSILQFVCVSRFEYGYFIQTPKCGKIHTRTQTAPAPYPHLYFYNRTRHMTAPKLIRLQFMQGRGYQYNIKTDQVIHAVAESAPQNLYDSLEENLGPNFDETDGLPNLAAENNLGSVVEQATHAIDKYMRHSKGYVPFQPMF